MTNLRKSSAQGPTQRQLRVGEEIRHILSKILSRGDYSHPLLEGASVIVTEVRISPDLKHAKVFITTLGGKNMEAIVKVLNEESRPLRNALGRTLTIKYTPQLQFRADTSFEEAAKIATLLHSEHVAQDLKKK
ncbi:MAG: 30S ribosome-binding factor RbfA [Candidatus Paracaedimonas acanthamoebae]|uniref:Ribosome-binding factor A n=1 Tax=Candidatus Paracaedimonas acanthamoebae TaxID=244581 RepID=A0A8J7TSU7_9PROT|nr:30S ribosome-binding factor RbfA [Candidatus Paracaedimonas acanthamoebae]